MYPPSTDLHFRSAKLSLRKNNLGKEPEEKGCWHCLRKKQGKERRKDKNKEFD